MLYNNKLLKKTFIYIFVRNKIIEIIGGCVCIDGTLTKSVASSELVKIFYGKHSVSVLHPFYSADNEESGKL